MDEPEEITARRWRFNLMATIATIDETTNLDDLQNPKLIEGFYDCVSDDGTPHGQQAMSDEERVAARRLFDALERICDDALAVRRLAGSRRGKTDDLIPLGWFEEVQPVARNAFDTFNVRGWLKHGLWG